MNFKEIFNNGGKDFKYNEIVKVLGLLTENYDNEDPEWHFFNDLLISVSGVNDVIHKTALAMLYNVDQQTDRSQNPIWELLEQKSVIHKVVIDYINYKLNEPE